MKARVKATGEIVEVDFHLETKRGKQFGVVTDTKRLFKPCRDYRKFYQDELEFISPEDTEVVDYWDKLLHQYAGMAMQGMIVDADNLIRERLDEQGIDAEEEFKIIKDYTDATADICIMFATALVKKLKVEK